jgi:hypothetical protein
VSNVVWNESESFNIYVFQLISTGGRYMPTNGKDLSEIGNIKMRSVELYSDSSHRNERFANFIPIITNIQRAFNSVIVLYRRKITTKTLS